MSPLIAPASLRPWQPRDVLVTGFLLMAGATLLVAGSIGAGGTRRWSEQILWVDLSAAGIIVGGAGIASWLLAGRRAVDASWLQVLVHRSEADVAERAGAIPSASDGGGVFVSAAPMTRYHRATCPAVAGKPVEEASRESHRDAGLEPCGICGAGGEVEP